MPRQDPPTNYLLPPSSEVGAGELCNCRRATPFSPIDRAVVSPYKVGLDERVLELRGGHEESLDADPRHIHELPGHQRLAFLVHTVADNTT